MGMHGLKISLYNPECALNIESSELLESLFEILRIISLPFKHI